MTVRVVTSLLDPTFDEAVVRRVGRADSGATISRRCVDVVALRSAAGAGIADVAIVDAGLRGLDRDIVSELHAFGVRVVAVGLDLARIEGVGVDAVVEPDVDAVVAALRGGLAEPTRGPADQSAPGGRVVAVWGATGAPGRTTVAIGLADEASRLGAPSLVVDVDTYGPALAAVLGLLEDSSGIAAACRLAGAGKLDVDALRRLSVRLPSGLRVLTGVAHPLGWDELRPSALDHCLAAARELAPVTVVDVGFCLEHEPLTWFEPGTPARNQAAVAALAAADTVVAVAGSDPLSLIRFIQSYPVVGSLAPTAEVLTVVNRSPSARQRCEEIRALLAEQLDVTPVAWLPDDREAMAAAVLRGRTLAEVAPRSALRTRLRALGAAVAGIPVPKKRRRAA